MSSRQKTWRRLGSRSGRERPRCRRAIGARIAKYVAVLWVLSTLVLGAELASAQSEDITFSRPSLSHPIKVSATQITRWRQGAYEVLHCIGPVEINQQAIEASSGEAILWVEIPDASQKSSSDVEKHGINSNANVYKIIAYLEQDTLIEISRPQEAADRLVDEKWLGRFFTTSNVDLNVTAVPLTGPLPAIFGRAQRALEFGPGSSVQQTQYQEAIPIQQTYPFKFEALPETNEFDPAIYGGSVSGTDAPIARVSQQVVSPQTGAVMNVPPPITQDPNFQTPSIGGSTPGSQVFPNQVPGGFGAPVARAPAGSVPSTRVEILGRDSKVDLNLTSDKNPNNPNERIWVGTGGVRVTITSSEIDAMEQFRGDKNKPVVILADNVVGWQSTLPDGTSRWELYLDGNVVFSKNTRAIYANQMYYDANFRRGTILNAEVLTSVPNYQGLVRLKADVVQQLDENNLRAYGSAFTSSRLGVPRYWLQSEAVGIQNQPKIATDPETGLPTYDQNTQAWKTEDEYFLESQTNQVYLGGVPAFWWPRLRMNMSDPTLYINRFKFGNDRIFGTQLLTGWNMYQLLGLRNAPSGTKWTGIVDYLSERGLALGSDFKYSRQSLFGIQGPVQGDYRSWFINDSGNDFLGRDRNNITPEEELRGRIWAQHQHVFQPGFRLRAELGYITDRNFLEQYYEREWDTQKDATTGLWLERNIGTQSFNAIADLQINDFFTQTSWLPRLDHFVIGQPLGRDNLVWHGHSHIGYGRLRVADAPLDPKDAAKFDPLAWENDVDGFRAGTRQEIDMPMQVGPVKVVPYALADATYWQEDNFGDDLFRAFGQLGVRASLSMWRVDPTIQSVLWNVNGLAHKVTFDMDAAYADASQDLDRLPLYDALDDDSQEHFRRRFAFDTFGILPGMDIPLEFDERFFAFRSGIQGNVTGPVEIADDLASIKMGVRQRWQTKRGLPGEERIIDWMTLDTQWIVFPNGSRDNFGPDLGMLDYDFRWHVGDRFSFVSDGYFDFFGQGLRTASFGMHLGRPEIGNVYLGYRMIEGPISSNIVTAQLTYRMSEKWGVQASSQVDFGETGTIGNTLKMIYIGESFLWQLGFNYDASRDNLSFRFGFEPRFSTQPRLFRPGGSAIPPAGSRWLE